MNYMEIKAKHPNWKILHTENMNTMINCASCGKELQYGDAYTAHCFNTDSGMFGLPICEKCYFGVDRELDNLYKSLHDTELDSYSNPTDPKLDEKIKNIKNSIKMLYASNEAGILEVKND